MRTIKQFVTCCKRATILSKNINRSSGWSAMSQKHRFSTATNLEVEGFCTYRTQESDPTNHGPDHLGQFYTVPPDVYDKLFQLGEQNTHHEELFTYMRECCLMVRPPALEIIDYLKQADYSRPANRYILYGKYGTGKTLIMNHVLHYGLNNQFILVHIGPKSTSRWFNNPRDEPVASESRPGRWDLPLDAAVWLQQFKGQNALLLSKLDLKVSRKYTWSIREATEAGDPLTNIIEHGISRIKHAPDAIAVLLKELKLLANDGKCKILVGCDLINRFYFRITNIRQPDQNDFNVEHFTHARAFKKLFRNDWKNGAVVAIVDNRPYIKKWAREFLFKGIPEYPKGLLGQEGFDDLDPFIPVRVDKYTEKEIESCLDYYVERKYILRSSSLTPNGRQEIKFVSGYLPIDLWKICASK